ncbi:MAG: LysR family transcriptional regulator [Scandinavium sp.]|uniref:LysR family transcriptional regulator n=1 Tax=Scandinavium sp. TaxID=2830653 RepID=UPI003F2ED637
MPKSLSLQDIENLSHFDLNLIIIFELIYRHRSIAKAAVSLGVSSPAVSQSLKKIREYFHDPLFIKSKNTLMPTILSEHIHANVMTNLSSLNNVIRVGTHESERKTFSIYSPPSIMSLMMPRLNSFSKQEGYHYEIAHHNIYSADCDIEDLFNYRKADIAISMTPVFNSYLTCESTQKKDLILVCNNNYRQVGDSITAEELTQHRWITSLANDAMVQMEIANFTRTLLRNERNIVFSSDSILPVLTALESFEGIGVISEDMFTVFGSRFNLRRISTDFPFSFSSYTYNIIYRSTMVKDASFIKIKELIKSALNSCYHPPSTL